MSKKFWLRTHTLPFFGAPFTVTEAEVIWTIDNFVNLKEENGQSILSPSFRIKHDHPGFKDTKWRIQLYPRGDLASYKGHIQNQSLVEKDIFGGGVDLSVFVHGAIGNKKIKMTPAQVNVSVSIVDICLNRMFEKTLKLQAVTDTDKISVDEDLDACYGDSNFFPRWDLNSKDQYDDGMLPGGSLTLAFKLSIETDEKHNNPTKADEETKTESIVSQTKGSKELSEHLRKLLESKEFSDIEIDCGGKVFSCHKYFVSARSPVFKTMFETKMKESESGKVIIEDIKPEIMSEMLHFMYTGSLAKETVTTEVAIELLHAADKYQLEALKDICQDKIRSVLDEENAIEFLILGEMYQANKLKDAALMEVAYNMPEIAGTEDYKRLRHYPDLALEIPLAMLK